MRRQYNDHNVNSYPGEGDAAGGPPGWGRPDFDEPPGWGRPDQERNVRSRSGRGWGGWRDSFSINQHVVVMENGRFQLHGIIVSTDGWQHFYHVRIMDGSRAMRFYHHYDIRHAEDMAAGFGH